MTSSSHRIWEKKNQTNLVSVIKALRWKGRILICSEIWLFVASNFICYNFYKIKCKQQSYMKGLSGNSVFHLTVLDNRHSLWEEKWTPICWRPSNINQKWAYEIPLILSSLYIQLWLLKASESIQFSLPSYCRACM